MKKFGIISLMISMFFLSGCMLNLEERKDNTEYGSLSCGDISRSIDVESIKSAKVTVTGPGINYELSTTCNDVKNGIGYFFIEKIPVGKNRIITVQAYDITGTAIDGAIIRTVIDINVGSNELEMINKSTSCRGNVYNALFEEGVDISNLSEVEIAKIEAIIPTYDECGEDLARLDVEGIVSDFMNSEVDLETKVRIDYVLPEEAYLKRLNIRQSKESTEKIPMFTLIALYSDGTEVDVTKEAEWYVTGENESVVSVEDGVVSFVGNDVGSVEVYGKYVDPNDVENKYPRKSPKAMLDVKFQEEKSNYIYFYNDIKKITGKTDADQKCVNYAMDAAKVAAWIWGDEIGSQWYPLETVSIYREENPTGQPVGTVWNHPIWQRVEIPEGAEGILFARGKSILDTEEWSGMIIPIYENGKDTGKTEGKPWNQTTNYTFATDIGTKNIYRPTVWEDTTAGGKTTGKWSSEDIAKIINSEIALNSNIRLVNESLEFVDVEPAHYYAKVVMEPSEDDTTLSSVKVNGYPLNIYHNMVYTLPSITDENGDKSVSVEAIPNSKDATVELSPYGAIVENGEYVEFEITVTAKDGNKEKYTVKVKREQYIPIDTEEPIEESDNGGIYIDDPENQVVTIIYDYKKWGETWNSEKIKAGKETHKVVIRGSFTKIYSSTQKRWKENTAKFTLIYDESYDRYSLILPYSELRVGFTGQPDFAFYVDGDVKKVSSVDFIDQKYIFNPDGNKIMILFNNDTEERLEKIAYNKEHFSGVKKLADFDISKKQDRANITNLRLVPGTTKLYRSYHPYYAGHDGVPTERVRIEEIQKLIEELGIKSDINLCEDKTSTVGNYYTIDNGQNKITYEITIPDYYQNILDNNNVFYIGDKRFGGNGIIPSADHVYYYSDSEYMLQWLKQLFDFINDESNQTPFLMHCEIGVDRTGVFSAIFAALCGATWDEIVADYETSNNLCIKEFRDANILKYSFERMLKVEDITKEADIKSLLYQYFISSGYISQSDLDSVVAKITAE